MKKSKAAILVALLTSLSMSGSVQAKSSNGGYAFDNAGDYEYGRSKYEVYYQSYLSACGPYQTTNQSDIFGSHETYEVLYPVIGQMDAELGQISAIKSRTRQSVVKILKETKQVMDIGYTMEKAHAAQLAEMKANTANIGGERYYTKAKNQVEVSRKDLDKAILMKRRDAEQKVLRLLKNDAERQRTGSNGEEVQDPSSYDRWQDCKTFWSYADTNNDQLKGQGYQNRSSNYR